VPAGVSQSDYVELTVLSGAQVPPDGTIITLDILDPDRSGSVSRSVTVKNLSSITQSTGLYFHIPNFTKMAAMWRVPTTLSAFSMCPAGGSQSTNVGLTVLSGSPTPPDGSFITLDISDLDRSASVSRSIQIHH
jgi:hypothetical protein